MPGEPPTGGFAMKKNEKSPFFAFETPLYRQYFA
jgi:hypothetical protein